MSLTKVSYSMIEGAFVNVLDYGATGDGVTDDTLAIQAAIDSGSPVFLPEGTYLLTLAQTINLEGGPSDCCLIAPTGMKLQGAGWGKTILKLKDGQSTDASPKYFNIIAANTVLDNVFIDGIRFNINGQNNPISPNRGSGVYNKYICSAFLVSGSTPTVGVDARIMNSKFTNLWIENSPGVTCIGLGQSNNPSVLGFNVEIAGCVFYNNGLDTDDHSSVYMFGENIDVHDNTFYASTMSNGTQGPRVAAELHGARNNFHDNDVYNYYQGVFVAQNGTNLSYNMNVSSNSFVCSTYGVVLFDEGGGPGLEKITISNNTIWITNDFPVVGQKKFGIGLNASYGTRQIVVSGNFVNNTDTYDSVGLYAYSLLVGSKISDVLIANNEFSGFPISIGIGRGIDARTDNIVVCDNLIVNVTPSTTTPTFTQGISISAATHGYIKIINNTILSTAYYGVYFDTLASCEYLYMDGNSSEPSTNTLIADLGTVIGTREGEQALTFAALPAQSTWYIGDFAYSSSVTQLGISPNKYLIKGWTRITQGTGNVLNTDWLENRVLTGN